MRNFLVLQGRGNAKMDESQQQQKSPEENAIDAVDG
jgi:hypothetical protein